ncbi:MAG: hypothetical protein K5769_09385 [Pseudobutyrivibrio sp.]|nr:hypothetical protein [Pseudobutyrivibrio sp.]
MSKKKSKFKVKGFLKDYLKNRTQKKNNANNALIKEKDEMIERLKEAIENIPKSEVPQELKKDYDKRKSAYLSIKDVKKLNSKQIKIKRTYYETKVARRKAEYESAFNLIEESKTLKKKIENSSLKKEVKKLYKNDLKDNYKRLNEKVEKASEINKLKEKVLQYRIGELAGEMIINRTANNPYNQSTYTNGNDKNASQISSAASPALSYNSQQSLLP